MSVKVKKVIKTSIIIILSLAIIPVFDDVIKFILQIGRIIGTLIRIIMEL